METLKEKKTTKNKAVGSSDSGGQIPKGKGSQTKVKGVVVVDSLHCITHEKIAQRAWSIWMSKGCTPGQDDANWYQAELALRMDAQR